MHLLEHSPVTARALASHLDLTSGSATALIARLVKAGLVTRTVDGNDRLVVNVALRPETWQRLTAIYSPAGQRVTEYSTTMTSRRPNATVRALHDIANQLDALRENR
jgi:DNA-binding MarR family transcriptional regulator